MLSVREINEHIQVDEFLETFGTFLKTLLRMMDMLLPFARSIMINVYRLYSLIPTPIPLSVNVLNAPDTVGATSWICIVSEPIRLFLMQFDFGQNDWNYPLN